MISNTYAMLSAVLVHIIGDSIAEFHKDSCVLVSTKVDLDILDKSSCYPNHCTDETKS